MLQKLFSCYNNNGDIMNKYKILEAEKDFIFRHHNVSNTKGSRNKRIIIDKKYGTNGFFKYEKYECSEACSEKLAYEIAKVLKMESAKIEFAKDENGTLGIISYIFINDNITHTDAKDFFNASQFDRKNFCTIKSIKQFLDLFGKDEFKKFVGIMIFDALIGEQDRHEENWGLIKENNIYRLSPLYDSSCNLLRDFKKQENAEKIYNGIIDFNKFILRSQTCIYKDNLKSRYKHFELIEYVYKKYPKIVKEELKKIRRLTNEKIKNIVDKLPNGIITEMHKEYICKYLIKRKTILLNYLKKGE